MHRDDFHAFFTTPGPVVLPVIHVLDTARTLRNIETLIHAGARGCFLINHDFGVAPFLPILRDVRRACPRLWLGVNFLGKPGNIAFPLLGQLARTNCLINAYWADDARISELSADQPAADATANARRQSGWGGLYFGGTAFKKQRPVAPAHYEQAARKAGGYMDVVTTSGIATGKEADLDKIAAFRRAIGRQALALASGITPENARGYGDVDCFMVATGINYPDNFYDIDPAKLTALLAVAKEIGKTEQG